MIFTGPQIATLGLTEEQAVEHGYAVQTSELPLSSWRPKAAKSSGLVRWRWRSSSGSRSTI
ncbi:MAG: hypothetical protein ACLQUT_06475 [Thermoleophilia bacterium]